MQVDTFFNTFIVCDYQGLLLINPRNIISNIIMLLNINATRGPTDCCSARLLGCGTRSPLYTGMDITCVYTSFYGVICASGGCLTSRRTYYVPLLCGIDPIEC